MECERSGIGAERAENRVSGVELWSGEQESEKNEHSEARSGVAER